MIMTTTQVQVKVDDIKVDMLEDGHSNIIQITDLSKCI